MIWGLGNQSLWQKLNSFKLLTAGSNLNHPIKILSEPEMEFKEFEPRFKSAKTRFKLSAGLNLESNVL